MTRARQHPAIAALAVAATGMVIAAVAGIFWPAHAVLPAPAIQSSAGIKVTFWDPTATNPTKFTVGPLGFNTVHHLDTDRSAAGAASTTPQTTCGDFMEMGELGGRCELEPDITLSANLIVPTVALKNELGIDVDGKLAVIRINRAPSAIVANPPRDAKPVHIEVAYTIKDINGQEPDATVSYGYETPPGGTIPTRLTAILGGLESVDVSDPADPELFDKITATIDTGQFGSTCGSANCPPGYAGPLNVVVGLRQEADTVDGDPRKVTTLSAGYKPLPEELTFTWDRGANRDLYIYDHKPPGDFAHIAGDNDAARRDVDLAMTLDTVTGNSANDNNNERTHLEARIDRLPSHMTADLASINEAGRRNQGELKFDVPPEAILPGSALPDAAIVYQSIKPSTEAGVPDAVQNLTANVHQIPTHLEAAWYQPVDPTPTSLGCKAVASSTLPDFDGDPDTPNASTLDPCLSFSRFKAGRFADRDPRVGSVELRVANYLGAPAGLVEFQPTRPQYVSQQSQPVTPGSVHLRKLLKARVEEIYSAHHAELVDGFTTKTRVGNGQLPLEVHVDTDERTQEVAPAEGTTPAKFGSKLNADAIIDPLPAQIELTLREADKRNKVPLRLSWNGTPPPPVPPSTTPAPVKAPDLDAVVEIREKEAAAGAACGDPFTMCAKAEIDHLPLRSDVSFLDIPDRLRVTMDSQVVPGQINPTTKPDAVLELTTRGKPDEPALVARFEGARLPDHLYANVETPLIKLPTEEDKDGERKLTRVEVYPCRRNDAGTACMAGTEAPIGSAAFDIRNFVERPADVPPQPVALTRQFLSAALGEAKENSPAFEAGDSIFHVAGRLDEVAEVQYLTPEGITAGRVRANPVPDANGNLVNQPFSALVDARAVEMSKGEGPQDLRAEAVIDKLPSEVNFCYRGAGQKYRTTTFDALTAPCENKTPFETVGELQRTPIAMDFQSNGTFRLQATLDKTDRAKSLTLDTHDKHTFAELDVRDVPEDITVYVQTPTEAKPATATEPAIEKQSAVRAAFATTPSTAPVTATFDIAITDADRYCTDPRVPPEVVADADTEITEGAPVDPDPERQFADALCVRGTIEKLPDDVFLEYDPDNEDKENFVFRNSGAGDINLVDVRLSSVKGEIDDRGTDATADDQIVPKVLVVDGDLYGLPKLLKGNLLPEADTAEFFTAPPEPGAPAGAVSAVEATIRNYIAPDLPVEMPTQRHVKLSEAAAAAPLPVPTEELVVFKRDDLFKAFVRVHELARAGFATARNADGDPLDTRIISVDFGAPNAVVRAYADLLFSEEPDKPDTDEREDVLSQVSVIGDVTLQEKPVGVTVCFRSKKESPGSPVAPTYCDVTPKANEGAFQVLGRPLPGGEPESSLDVDAFVRFGKGGGTDLLTGAVHIDNVPAAVQGTFSDEGRVEVAGFEVKPVTEEVNGQPVVTFEADTSKPVGIDRVIAQLSNFDLPGNAGYVDEPEAPWGRNLDGPNEPMKTNFAGDHFVRLRVIDEFYYVQAGLGVVGGPDSEAQRVFIDKDPCGPPPGNPADFPYYPIRDAIAYACIRLNFEERNGPAPDPLYFELATTKDGEHFTLNGLDPFTFAPAKAGLTRIPSFVQAVYADTEGLDSDTSALLPPCGPTATPGCVPPMIRVDIDHQYDSDPVLFGLLESGTPPNISRLRNHEPDGESAWLQRAPNELGWPDWNASSAGHGVRAKIGSYKQLVGEGTPEAREDTVTTMVAGIHIPVPRSLTVDQIQTWNCTVGEPGPPPCTPANPEDAVDPPGDEEQGKNLDLRFRYVARDRDGVTEDSLGQMVLLVDLDGKDILIASADDPGTLGMPLPGELGLAVYMRESWQKPDSETVRNRKFIQIDGRMSSEAPIGARIFGLDGVHVVHAKLRGYPTLPDISEADRNNPTTPAFRLRTEIQGDQGAGGGGGGIGSAIASVLLPMKAEVEIEEVKADIDFSGARRVDGVVHLNGKENATELRGYRVLHGSDEADEVEISGTAGLDISKLRLVFAAHLFFTGVAGVVWLKAKTELDFEKARRFKFQNNALRIKVDHKGANAGFVDVDPDVYPVLILAVAWLITPWVFSIMGVIYAWPPAIPPQMLIAYFACNLGASGPVNGFTVPGNASADVYADPAFDPRIILYGGEKLISLAKRLIGGKWFTVGVAGGKPAISLLLTAAARLFACGFSDVNLKTITADNPGPPIFITSHPVPGFDDDVTPSPGNNPPPPPPPDLDVTGVKEVCGDESFGVLRIKSGGRLHACNGAGGVTLTAKTIEVFAGGVVDARDATGEVSLAAETISIAPDPDTDAVDERGKVLVGASRVALTGLRLLRVDGAVFADGVRDLTTGTGTGNAGAGHAGAGGDGSTGTGGGTYADLTLEPDQTTELVAMTAGSKGSGPGTPGRGGGTIELMAATVRVSGQVTADGTPGSTDASGLCFRENDPATDTDDLPNTGKAGAGGGSGGTVLVRASEVNLTGGRLSAAGGGGGNGKAGGGGGGGGGAVKIIAPLLTGTPVVDGGTGGTNGGCADAAAGADGADGVIARDSAPSSQAHRPPGDFWHRGVDNAVGTTADGAYELRVPFGGAAAPQGPNPDFQVALCGVHRPPEAIEPPPGANPESSDPNTPKSSEPKFGIDMPTSQSGGQFCGAPTGDTPVHVLGTTRVPASSRAPDNATVLVDPAVVDGGNGEGFWGLYTIIAKPLTSGNDCFNHSDRVLFNSGVLYDQVNCRQETLPSSPDDYMGIDNDVPDATVEIEPTATNETIQLRIADVADSTARHSDPDAKGPLSNQSGVATVECANGDADLNEVPSAYTECLPGRPSFTLTPGSGLKKVFVRITDIAGNRFVHSQEVDLDVDPPSSKGVPVPVPGSGLQNGWYSTSPHFRLDSFEDVNDDGVQGAGPAAKPYEFWFDNGTHRFCANPGNSPSPVCIIDDDDGLPGVGRHTFNWRAIDAAGHPEPIQTIYFKVDGKAPRASLLTAPFEADGANTVLFNQAGERGWFITSPFVVVSGLDEPGGSGLVPNASVDPDYNDDGADDDGPDGDGGGLYLGIDGEEPKLQTEPRMLTNGTHTACFYARDVAGNTSSDATNPECVVLHVDAADPTASVDVTSPTPPANGWYRTVPVVSVSTTDPGGSGVDPTFDSTADLCGQLPPDPNPRTPSGECLWVDRGVFSPTTDTTLPADGVHRLRAFAVDVAGRRSAVVDRIVPVDRTAPIASARVFPPRPDSPPLPAPYIWRTQPTITLLAADHEDNSGVAAIKYRTCIPGPCASALAFDTYTGPFPLPDGRWTIEFKGVDVAGNEQPFQTLVVPVDTTPPTAVATVPVPGGTTGWSRNPPDDPMNPAQLVWTMSDPGTPANKLHVAMLIYGAVQNNDVVSIGTSEPVKLLRRVELAPLPGPTFSYLWNGKMEITRLDLSITDPALNKVKRLEPVPKRQTPLLSDTLPLSGRYWYRVVVTDEAGNVTHTEDSTRIQVDN